MNFSIDRAAKLRSWPDENNVRGRYYLSQVRKQTPGVDAKALAAADQMEAQAKRELYRLLERDNTGMATKYEDNLPMLFDFLVHWENRLVTPRKSGHVKEAIDVAQGDAVAESTVVEKKASAVKELGPFTV